MGALPYRQPVPPAERLPNFPAALSAIVMKLLPKTAEDRYQTAAGLESDLRRCLTEWEAQQRIDDFPLGEHDTPDWLLMPEKLYGRQREVETLLASFNRIVNGGAPELTSLSAYSASTVFGCGFTNDVRCGPCGVAVGLECLRHVGIDWPAHPTELDARLEEDGNQGVAFVLDLTERKRAEEALRQLE